MRLSVRRQTPLPVGLARRAGGARVPRAANLRRDLERAGAPAECFAGSSRLGRPQCGAVHFVRTGLVRASLADHGLAAHQCRSSAILAGLLQRRLDRHGVMAVDSAHDPPAIRFKAPGCVVGKPILDMAIDTDAVVIIHGNQLRQSQRSCQRAGLVADAFHQAAIADEHPGAMVDNAVAGPIEFGCQQLLAQRHTDRIGQALAKRAGGGFHTRCDADFRMTRRAAVQLPKAHQFLDRQRVAGQVQQRVQQHRAMAVRQDEAVAVGPDRIGGIVLQKSAPQHLGDFGHTHRHAGMTAVGGFHRIDCQKAQRVAPLALVGVSQFHLRIHACF